MLELPFQALPADDQREALLVAAGRSGRPAYLLEKDLWVVWALQALVNAPFGHELTFKGGTSLSKAYGTIRRFSEDLDITFDIRAIAADLVADNDGEVIPSTRNQERRWSRTIRKRLAQWVAEQALPAIAGRFEDGGLDAHLRGDGDRVFITYRPTFEDYDFVRPEVMVEFGARSTGDPREERLIECDAAVHLPGIAFLSSRPHVMLAERTFWEKATAAHVFCRQRRMRGDRLSRHWYDLVRLDEAEYGARALADRGLALDVARHKSVFFRENDSDGNVIDYIAAVSGDLQLVPGEPALGELADDYARMAAGGMLLDDAEAFETVMERCSDIQAKANG